MLEYQYDFKQYHSLSEVANWNNTYPQTIIKYIKKARRFIGDVRMKKCKINHRYYITLDQAVKISLLHVYKDIDNAKRAYVDWMLPKFEDL